MDDIIEVMLARYNCKSVEDYSNALKEIIQEIALLGLWRAKFFEHAAFYGGSALRILYGLDRFSEDLDFSLLHPNASFSLASYNQAVKSELTAFGFECEVESIAKTKISPVQSAFIKAGTRLQFIKVGVADSIARRVQHNEMLKIKFEVDIDPPGDFETEPKVLLQPIPFSVNTFTISDLFAGKLHALLCRKWQTRVKGRDWYDFVWFIGRGVGVHLQHLKTRMVQSGNWSVHRDLKMSDLKNLLREKTQSVDFKLATADVLPFVRDADSIKLWSEPFFLDLFDKLKSTS